MNRFLKVALVFVLLLTIGAAGIVSAQYNTPASITVTLNNVEAPVTLDDVTPIGVYQCELPVVGSLPPSVFTTVNLSLVGTDFVWTVNVDPDGMFLTNFPVCLFPAGRYYLAINGTSVTQVEIPERG